MVAMGSVSEDSNESSKETAGDTATCQLNPTKVLNSSKLEFTLFCLFEPPELPTSSRPVLLLFLFLLRRRSLERPGEAKGAALCKTKAAQSPLLKSSKFVASSVPSRSQKKGIAAQGKVKRRVVILMWLDMVQLVFHAGTPQVPA